MTMTEKAMLAERNKAQIEAQKAKVDATRASVDAMRASLDALLVQYEKMQRRLYRQELKLRKMQVAQAINIGEIDDVEILIENMTA